MKTQFNIFTTALVAEQVEIRLLIIILKQSVSHMCIVM